MWLCLCSSPILTRLRLERRHTDLPPPPPHHHQRWPQSHRCRPCCQQSGQLATGHRHRRGAAANGPPRTPQRRGRRPRRRSDRPARARGTTTSWSRRRPGRPAAAAAAPAARPNTCQLTAAAAVLSTGIAAVRDSQGAGAPSFPLASAARRRQRSGRRRRSPLRLGLRRVAQCDAIENGYSTRPEKGPPQAEQLRPIGQAAQRFEKSWCEHVFSSQLRAAVLSTGIAAVSRVRLQLQ